MSGTPVPALSFSWVVELSMLYVLSSSTDPWFWAGSLSSQFSSARALGLLYVSSMLVDAGVFVLGADFCPNVCRAGEASREDFLSDFLASPEMHGESTRKGEGAATVLAVDAGP